MALADRAGVKGDTASTERQRRGARAEADRHARPVPTRITSVPRSLWRAYATHHAREISDELSAIDFEALDPPPMRAYELARARVEDVETIINARRRGVHRIQDWFSGTAIETSWCLVYEGHDALIMCQPLDRLRARLPSIVAQLHFNLRADDPRRTEYADRLAALRTAPDAELQAERPYLREVQRTVNSASAAAHAIVRSFRDLLVGVGTALFVLLVAIAVLHAVSPGVVDLRSREGAGGDPVEAWEVMVLGGLGGMLGAILTVVRLGGFAGPYRLPIYQALMRVPMGAATATAGAILMQSSLIGVLNPQPRLALLAYCLLFGYAPDVLLRFLDQRLAEVLGKAQGRNDPSTPTAATATRTATTVKPR